ncbi:PASTA domain-containing protein [Fluviicola sp.]|uniref:PASTA domain-containing protein n=1 Tax=Fluviicola sp. TaxID=1917219 RepID=UPI0031D5A851
MGILLSHPDRAPIPPTTVVFQYYDFETESWVHLYEQVLNSKGAANVSAVRRTGMPPEEVAFFDLVSDKQIPPLRVIPTEFEGDISKQPVFANGFDFDIASSGTLTIDFGGLYLVPEALITDLSTRIENYVMITSSYPVPVPTDNTPLPINELYTNLVSEIATASDSGSPFKLSNVSLKLKALIERDGETVNASLLDLTNSKDVNGNAISEIVFDITPVQQTDDVSKQIPDLTGFTESAVRKILQAFGLKLNPVYQKNLNVVNGDSFRQSPEAGEIIESNKIVTVIFSKHE